MLVVREAVPADADEMQERFAAMGWKKRPGYFAERLGRCRDTELCLIARSDDAYCGHAFVVRVSHYAGFRARGIPELQDLAVLPAYRRCGVATALIGRAEELIAPTSAASGISVGLHPGYDAARRLYVRLGYAPDGCSVTWHGAAVREGQQVVMDDELLVHLVKDLSRAR